MQIDILLHSLMTHSQYNTTVVVSNAASTKSLSLIFVNYDVTEQNQSGENSRNPNCKENYKHIFLI